MVCALSDGGAGAGEGRAVDGRALVLKVDTDAYPQIAARYNVRGIPNFVVLKDGQLKQQHAGLVRHTEMQRWLETA